MKSDSNEEYLSHLEAQRAHIYEELAALPGEQEGNETRQRELYLKLDSTIQRIEAAQKDIEAAKIRTEISRARRTNTLDTTLRYSVLITGCAVFFALAYLFKSNTSLASIPLLGLVVFIILWPLFEKFRLLERVTAEFRPGGVNVTAAASGTDDYLRLQSELAKKKIELETAKLQRELDHVQSSHYLTEPMKDELPKQGDDKKKEVLQLGSPGPPSPE